MNKCAMCVLSIYDEQLGEYKCFHYQRHTTEQDNNCKYYIEKRKKD